MANHYRHPVATRRDRAIERLLELLTRIVEWWVEFWHTTEPGVHAEGATDRWADTLHDIDITPVHDQLSDEPGLYRLLLDATTISGQEWGDLTTVDGWSLSGSLVDQTGGAV